MTVLEILSNIENNKNESNVDLVNFISSIKSNINSGQNYKYLEKIDDVLNYFKNNNQQLEIINKKFDKLKTRHELFDILVELLICGKHLNENPEFIKENDEETPDIKTNLFLIEIKRIRISEDQKEIIEKIIDKNQGGNDYLLNSQSQNFFSQKEKENSLFNKIKEKIDKAISQIKGEDGIIYLIYSLDLNGYLKMLDERKMELFCNAINYFQSKEIKNIKLKIVELNSLFK